MFRYRITLTESERGWGQSSWHESFDTPELAQARIDEVNAKNTAPVAPDYYVRADTRITAVKVEQ